MPPVGGRSPAALVDTNVLWPVALVNLMLSTAEDGFYELGQAGPLDDLVRRTRISRRR